LLALLLKRLAPLFPLFGSTLLLNARHFLGLVDSSLALLFGSPLDGFLSALFGRSFFPCLPNAFTLSSSVVGTRTRSERASLVALCVGLREVPEVLAARFGLWSRLNSTYHAPLRWLFLLLFLLYAAYHTPASCH
jgi:hypothetical protein